MRTVDAYETKTDLIQLLEQVAQGEAVTLTKHGVPIAILQPAVNAQHTPAEKRLTVEEAIAELKDFRKGNRLDGLTIREMIEEGRRY
jgi:prevent-host-death family protein